MGMTGRKHKRREREEIGTRTGKQADWGELDISFRNR